MIINIERLIQAIETEICQLFAFAPWINLETKQQLRIKWREHIEHETVEATRLDGLLTDAQKLIDIDRQMIRAMRTHAEHLEEQLEDAKRERDAALNDGPRKIWLKNIADLLFIDVSKLSEPDAFTAIHTAVSNSKWKRDQADSLRAGVCVACGKAWATCGHFEQGSYTVAEKVDQLVNSYAGIPPTMCTCKHDFLKHSSLSGQCLWCDCKRFEPQQAVIGSET